MSYSRLSTQQLDIYKEQLLYPNSTIYNLIGVVSIKGKIDVGNFIEVVRFFVSNSPILNSKISIIDNVPVLERINDPDIKLEVIEYDQTQDISEFYNTFIEKVSLVPFDIKSDNRLCSFSILHLSNKNLYLVAKFHHILIDAWGANLALNQVIKSYNNIYSGKTDVPPVQYDYSVYLNNELEYLASDKYQKDKRFWKSEFLAKPEQLFKKQYQNIDPLNCTIEKVIISRREYELLSNSVSHLNSNFFHITLGMLFVLFYKLNGTSNFCVGIPVLNRKNSYFLNTIGLFVSVFPLRIDFDGEFTLNDLVTNIISKLKTNYRFQRFPVSEISREVNIDSATKIPLYEIALSNINFDSNEKIESAEVEYLHVPNKAQALPVSVYIGDFDDNNDICIDFIFNESYFTDVQIRSILDSFSRLMSMFPEAIDTKIKEIDLVSFAEAEKFSAFISESTDQPFVPIHKLFESIAVEYSDRIAIVSDAKALTYRELNEKANILSDFLMHTCSVRKGECIGVQIDNSEYLVIALLAILKIGASYIPIDVKVPEDRLSFMLLDSRSKLLLAENDLENIGINYINVIKIFETSFDLNSCNPNCVIEEYDSIYTIYTSGSTGDPKGATVSHGSFSNLMNWYIGLFDKQRGNSTLLVAPISFDLAQKNIFAPLLTGSKLYLHKFMFMDYDYIKKILLGEPIEYINCAPSAFYPLVNFGELGEGYEHLERLQILVLGGEPINGKNLVNWIQSDRFSTRLINTYGPTECTDISSSYEITKQEISEAKNIPIGKPILNSRTYILDKYSRILPPGFVGEIAIGGKGVGKGYINNYQLTKERFIKDAYSSGLIYLTGDMGVYRENGIIEYYGRLDNQVKVNGYRVELEEIEKQLNKSEFIQSSVVVLDNKGKLLSYVIPKGEVDKDELRRYLLSKLPAYMVPTRFYYVKEFPLNKNGKVDRKLIKKNLVEIEADELSNSEVTNSYENIVREVWKDVLGVENIGVDENFLALGGDSISALRVVSKLNDHGISISVQDLYLFLTIRGMADWIINNSEISLKGTQDFYSPSNGYVNLSPIQKWFFQKYINGENHFSQTWYFGLKNRIESRVIKDIFKRLIEYHDILRSKVIISEEELGLWINEEIINNDFFSEVKTDATFGSKEVHHYINQAQNDISIIDGRMIRVLFFTGEGIQSIAVIIHHLVVDGISWRILFQDFVNLLSNSTFTLPPRTLSFQDWTKAQGEFVYSSDLKQEVDFWKTQMSESFQKIAPENIHRIERVRDREFRNIQFESDVFEKLSEYSLNLSLSNLQDLFIAIVLLAVKRTYGLNTYKLYLEGHGRESLGKEMNISRTVGWFTSLYPLLFSIGDGETIDGMISIVNSKLREVKRGGTVFGMLKYLTEHLNIDFAEPEMCFNYLGNYDEGTIDEFLVYDASSAWSSINPESVSPFKLEIIALVLNRKLEFRVFYNSQEFNTETILRFLESIENIVKEAVVLSESFGKGKNFLSGFTVGDLDSEELDELFEK